MMRAIRAACVLTAAVAGCGATVSDARTIARGTVPLTITTPGATHRFDVEVARTPDQQARGLMYRTRLGPREGMIFPMNPPRVASFWMKNTVIPLDIIFVRIDGTIARIAARTTPYSLAPVDSGEPVAAVLEIAGGRAAALGVTEGARVTWKP